MQRVGAFLFALAFLAGCVSEQAQQPELQSQPAASEKVFLPADGPTEKDHPDLHNLLQITDKVYSGGEPENEAAFAELFELGVKVIVSVDGATPNQELAQKYGMRYVHIPIGYDGITAEAVKSFARAADELDETTYVHCHHGTHRGPAGAAAICVARGDCDGETAMKILQKAGTSKKYPGLWRDVKGYHRPPAGQPLPTLVAVAKIDSVPKAMAKLDRAADNLTLSQEAGWTVPKDHPDLVPGEEAHRVVEGLQDAQQHLAGKLDNAELRGWLSEAIEASRQFESALRTGQLNDATARFTAVQQACSRCHAKYRNQ